MISEYTSLGLGVHSLNQILYQHKFTFNATNENHKTRLYAYTIDQLYFLGRHYSNSHLPQVCFVAVVLDFLFYRSLPTPPLNPASHWLTPMKELERFTRVQNLACFFSSVLHLEHSKVRTTIETTDPNYKKRSHSLCHTVAFMQCSEKYL